MKTPENESRAKMLVETFYKQGPRTISYYELNLPADVVQTKSLRSFPKYLLTVKQEKEALQKINSSGVKFTELGPNDDNLSPIIQMLARPEDRVFVIDASLVDEDGVFDVLTYLAVGTPAQETLVARLSAKNALGESNTPQFENVGDEVSDEDWDLVAELRDAVWGCQWPMEALRCLVNRAAAQFNPTEDQLWALQDILMGRNTFTRTLMQYHVDYAFWNEHDRLSKLCEAVPREIRRVCQNRAKDALS